MSAPLSTQANPRRALWLAGGGLVLVAVVAYGNSLAGPFVFDDQPAIVGNLSIRQLWPVASVLAPALDGSLTVSGRPLVNLSLALNYAFGGESVTGYHAINLLFHLLAGLTLLGVVRRTLMQATLAPFFGPAALPVAWSATALWLVHPLQTAAVTYVVQRAEVLVSLCYLLTLYGFIRGADARPEIGSLRPEKRNSPVFWFGVSLVACLAGMASKEVMVTAPVMVFLYDRTFIAGNCREAWRCRWKYHLSLAATWLLLAWLVAASKGRGGTAGFGVEVSSWDYALTQCQAIVHYLRLVVWPHPLVFDYGMEIVDGIAAVWWQALLLVSLVAALGWALVRRPALGYAGAWFFVLLAPSSSVVPVVTQTMAEHRVYLALAAPVVLVAAGLYAWLGRRAWPVVGLLVVPCVLLTSLRNTDYATEHGLWADTVAKRPTSARAHHNLGLAELARGRLEQAARHLRDAVALAPHSPESLYNLGVVLTRMKRPGEAIDAYESALRVAPNHAGALNNLANVLRDAGRAADAGRYYAEAVRLHPDLAGLRNSYGNWLIDAGQPAGALVQLEEAIRLQPGMAEAHFNAGNACAGLRRPAAAADYYRAAIQLQPSHAGAHHNLGNALLELNRTPEAIAEFETALRIQPEYFEPRRTLGLLLLLHLNCPAEARGHLEILARARPDDAEVARALAQARVEAP